MLYITWLKIFLLNDELFSLNTEWDITFRNVLDDEKLPYAFKRGNVITAYN